uniref:Uncharacterized protein n=1 Tax=Arundo donax TaxID=35708 RepID=A0A0A9EP52_ARUDO
MSLTAKLLSHCIISVRSVATLMHYEFSGIRLTQTFNCLCFKVSVGGYNDKMRVLLNAILKLKVHLGPLVGFG